MSKKNNDKITKHLEFMYSHLNPIRANDSLRDAAIMWAEISKSALNIGSTQEYHVSLSRFSANISVNIGRMSALPNAEILYINDLTLEVLSDLLLFAECQSKDCFEYIFSKYMTIITSDPSRHNEQKFFGWLNKKFQFDSKYSTQHFLYKAVAGGIFVTLHEWVHTKPKLQNASYKIMHSELNKIIPNGVEEELFKEIICDFDALSICAEYGYDKLLHCTKNEFIQVAIISLFLPDLYSLFTQLLLQSGGQGNHRFDFYLSRINDTLTNRCFALTVLLSIAKNSSVFFENFDIQTIVYDSLSVIEKFLKHFGEYLLSDIHTQISIYNSIYYKEVVSYSEFTVDAPWFYFS